MHIPTTKITLLSEISTSLKSPRWSEFAKIYTPVMRSYLDGRFPGVPADDIIQDTLVALMQCMPNYKYNPDERGHFRNYLIGIVRHKAIRHLKLAARESEELEEYLRVAGGEDSPGDVLFRQSVYELALQELLADRSIQDRTKNIFIQVAINGEKPEDVARNFGVTRNGVDQIKARMIAKLRKISEAMLQGIERFGDLPKQGET